MNLAGCYKNTILFQIAKVVLNHTRKRILENAKIRVNGRVLFVLSAKRLIRYHSLNVLQWYIQLDMQMQTCYHLL